MRRPSLIVVEDDAEHDVGAFRIIDCRCIGRRRSPDAECGGLAACPRRRRCILTSGCKKQGLWRLLSQRRRRLQGHLQQRRPLGALVHQKTKTLFVDVLPFLLSPSFPFFPPSLLRSEKRARSLRRRIAHVSFARTSAPIGAHASPIDAHAMDLSGPSSVVVGCHIVRCGMIADAQSTACGCVHACLLMLMCARLPARVRGGIAPTRASVAERRTCTHNDSAEVFALGSQPADRSSRQC